MTTTQATQKRDELMEKLSTEVESLKTSEGWRRWMRTASRFHSYSLRNQLLIAAQRPEATRVAGFNTWKSLGRSVLKGERGIAIMAPAGRYASEGKPATSDVEDSVEDEPAQSRTAFRVVYVFDISQTDGLELSEMSLPVLDQPGQERFFESLRCVTRELGIELITTDVGRGEARGWYEAESHRITILNTFPVADQCATLTHELAHALDPRCNGSQTATRAERELVAESVAYIVGTRAGLAMDDASANYTASWGADAGELQRLAASVLEISEELDNHIAAVDQIPLAA